MTVDTTRGSRINAAAISAAVLLACTSFARAQFAVPELPALEGPISGPGAMYTGLRPAPAPSDDPADFGYVTEEYFASGTAKGQPYRTRILVRRSEHESRFSGIVVSEVMHSSGFAETFQPAMKSLLMRGHVHVEIAAQHSNVYVAVKPFNPERYASLSLTSSAQTTEIISQVALLLKSNLRHGPLAPLMVRRLILQGTSQASDVLRDYQARQHFQSRMPDGGPIVDGYLAASTNGSAPMMVVDVPTVHMPTMTEVNNNGIAFRRADSDESGNRYRLYEVAGAAHANSRDVIAYVPNPCTLPVSQFPWGAMLAMGLHHLIDWTDRGIVPPHAPPLEFDNNTANDGSRLALDENGNVKGGVRNTYVDVPVAAYGVPNGTSPKCSIAGWRIAYDEETLRQLYKNHDAYFTRVNGRLMELIREGWMLPEYAEDVRADARAVFIPNPGRAH